MEDLKDLDESVLTQMDRTPFNRDLDPGDREIERVIWIHQTITFQSG
jgi:hypothetical protein